MGQSRVTSRSFEIDGYVVWKNDRRSFTVYEKHPSGDLVRVGRCESRGGAKRLIRKHKASKRLAC